MLTLIGVLAILEAEGVNKVKIFKGVEVDLAHLIETTLENKIITLQKIVKLAISQLGSRMTYVIVVD